MPIVFAFELFEQPPEHFVQTAWQLAPLLVCAAFRDGDRLKLLQEPSGRYFALRMIYGFVGLFDA